LLNRLLRARLLLFFLFVPTAQAEDSAPPQFVVHSVDGQLPPAPLELIGEDWAIVLGGKNPRTLSAKEWLSMRREGAHLLPFPSKNSALLTTGDRILLEPGAAFRLEEESLYLVPEKGTEINVPIAFLSYLCLGIPEGTVDPARFLANLKKAKRSRDIIQLKSGDRMEGTLRSPAKGPIYAMSLGDRSVEAPLDQIAIVALNTELQARPKMKKSFAHVVTSAGARFQFSVVRLDPQKSTLIGKTFFGATLKVPLAEIAALSLRQGPAVYLSDLTPKKYEFTPYLGLSWPLAADAAITGRQLVVAGDYYDKGLGMHAQSKATYTLDGNFRYFEALVGLAEGTGVYGQARVSVLVDGSAVISRKELTQSNPAFPVRIDVSKGNELSLVVEFGHFGDVQGRVNWADSRLVK